VATGLASLEKEQSGVAFADAAWCNGQREEPEPMQPATEPRTNAKKPARFALIDLLRGLAILAMVAYHVAWDLYYLGFTATDVMAEPAWIAFQRGILASFLLLVGAALVLAHGSAIRWPAFWRRFAVVLAAALLVSAGTYAVFPDFFVFFGVLHAIAVFSLCALPLLRAPLWLVLVMAAGFLLTPALLVIPEFSDRRLAWIGLWAETPPTTDIVPFFPWLGVMLLGVAAMRILLASPWRRLLESWQAGRWSRWLTVAGRWSLVIYLVHQPLLFGGLTLLAQLQPPASMPGTVSAFIESCESGCVENGSGIAWCQRYCSCALEQVEREDLWSLLDAEAPTAAGQEALNSVQRLCSAMAR
jgi:uncharacterized membrane protein